MTQTLKRYLTFMSLTLLSFAATSVWSQSLVGAESTRLLRFADIYKDKVSFVYAGDIYIASSTGGEATKLTSGEGLELFPKFSPDGRKIAFSAEYSGSRQVWVMDVDGKNLRQLTFYNDVGVMAPRGGFDYRVLDWTPDAKNILVRANRLPWGRRMGRPMYVPVDGGMPVNLAVPETGGGMLSPDGSTLVYTPIDREFRTWKRYRGGRAQDIWTYDLVNNSSKQLTTFKGTDQHPLWIGEDIFFVSDREYTLNLYQYVEGAEPIKLTTHKKFDVLWPSAGPESIVYENGGHLYRFDPATKTSTHISIVVPGLRPYSVASFKDVRANVESYDISPDGNRVVVAARGELFTLPKKFGPTRNISRSGSAREINATWSPDGKYILYLSDASGEYELYLKDEKGKAEPNQLTQNNETWLFPPRWSANSEWIAWADKNQTLWIKNLDGNAIKVDRARYSDIEYYRFSPDSEYLVYQKDAKNGLSQIWLYDIKNKRSRQLSNGTTSDWSPVFDPQGRYLYFLSNRDFELSFSDREFNYIYDRSTRIYAAPLHSDARLPGGIHSDEVGEVAPSEEDKADEKAPKIKPITLNRELMSRTTVALSASPSAYSSLAAINEAVLVIETSKDGVNTLKKIAIDKDQSIETVAKKIDDYRLAHSGSHILIKKGKHFSIIEPKKDQKLKASRIDMSQLQLRIDPKVEWLQIYTDAWRTLRDWFYDPNLHGNDWQKIYDKYRPLVNHIAHRTDLDYILGEIAGELNAGHIYVQAGDQPKVKRVDGGLLGAEIEAHESGHFRIAHIFSSENWHESLRSPLSEPGVDVKEDEFIISVNGVSTKGVKNFYSLMENTAEKIIALEISTLSSGKLSREVFVKPIASETKLRYLSWVKQRAAYVDKLSGGRIGYVHLPNTHIDGNRELFKQLQPQIHKEALIIDDRYNGGGFIPDRMIEVLARKPLNYWVSRGLDPQATPFYHHDGPKAMLVNAYSSSGGDALPYYFRKLGLGKIIGTRTWGGLIGISGNPSLVDGGQVLAATFRFLDTDGRWAVENEGITPDINVVDRPELIAGGKDPSIERAVEELLKELGSDLKEEIKVPPAPIDF